MSAPDLVAAVEAALDDYAERHSGGTSYGAAVVAVRALVDRLPNAPTPVGCCGDAESRGRLCQYHQGFEDGWEALLDRLGAA